MTREHLVLTTSVTTQEQSLSNSDSDGYKDTTHSLQRASWRYSPYCTIFPCLAGLLYCAVCTVQSFRTIRKKYVLVTVPYSVQFWTVPFVRCFVFCFAMPVLCKKQHDCLSQTLLYGYSIALLPDFLGGWYCRKGIRNCRTVRV